MKRFSLVELLLILIALLLVLLVMNAYRGWH